MLAFTSRRTRLRNSWMTVYGQCCLLTVTYVPALWVTTVRIKPKVVWADRQYGNLDREMNNLTSPEILTRLLCCQHKVKHLPTGQLICVFYQPRSNRPPMHGGGGLMWLSVCLEGCGIYRLHHDSIPGPLSTYRAVIPTELSCPSRENEPHYKFTVK